MHTKHAVPARARVEVRSGVARRQSLRQLLKCPRVPIGIREACHSDPASEVSNVVDVDTAFNQRPPSFIDVVHDEVQTADRPGCSRQARQALCEHDRAR